MFEKIRKPRKVKRPIKTLINTLIFGLICVVFIFIGGPFGDLSPSGGSALVVNKQGVSLAEYQTYLNILQSQSGKAGADPDLLRKQTLEILLKGELIRQSAHKIKMAVSSQEKRDLILSLPFLQEDGRWTQGRYHAFLESQRLSPAKFEKRVKKDILSQRFQNLFDQVAFVSSMEDQKKKNLKSLKANISYVQFSSAQLSAEESIKLEELVKGESPSLLNHFIQEKKAEWKTTGVFYLDRFSLPKLESYKALWSELWSYLPKKGLIKKVIYVQDQSFILKVENFSEEPSNASQVKELDSMDSFFTRVLAGQALFMSWLTDQKTQANIQINPRLNPISPQ